MQDLTVWRRLSHSDSRLLFRSKLFDFDWYRSQSPSVPPDRRDAIDHFLKVGAADGLDPHPLFNTAWYCHQYATELGHGRNPLVDYLHQGAFAGRDPNPWFDSKWYLSRHPELRAERKNPLEDYVTGGWRIGRDPHPNFSIPWYLTTNEDVASAGYEPLAHFVVSGEAEGRKPCPPERWTPALHPRPKVSTAEPRLMQPEFNFGAGSLTRRLICIREPHLSALQSASAIFGHAKTMAARQQFARVVDFGPDAPACADTAAIADEVWLVDWRPRTPIIEHAIPIVVQLDRPVDLDRLAVNLDNRPTLYILRHVVETLHDPRPLLRVLRRALRRHPENRILLATLDRSSASGTDTPLAPQHARLWSRHEFIRFIEGAGFEIVAHHVLEAAETGVSLLFELSCDEKSYRAFIARHNLPEQARHLVLTTEHARALRTAGIGSFHDSVEKATGLPRLTMYCGIEGLPPRWLEFVRKQGWLHCAELRGRGWRKLKEVASVSADEILEAVLQALFIYDVITLVEYQELLGIGACVAQAKRAGLIPPSVLVIAYAHGNHFYLDQAEGVIPRHRDPTIDLHERISLEQADCVVFPSEFLQRLVTETQGLRLRNTRIQPHPVQFNPTPAADTAKIPIDTLIFLGRRSIRKGYEDFCAALLSLWEQPEHRTAREHIKTVIMVGVASLDPRLEALQGVTVEYGDYSHPDVINLLHDRARQSLIVLPYRGGNQPLSFFEAAESGADLVAYRAGGIPALLSEDLAAELLCEPNVPALITAIVQGITRTEAERCDLCSRMQMHLMATLSAAAIAYRTMMVEFLCEHYPPAVVEPPGAVTVIIPNRNGPSRFWDDLCFGLENSFISPERTLIIDDGSTPNYLGIAEAACMKIPNCQIMAVSHRGLPGARNFGLTHVDTPYVCAHDGDNVISNDFLGIAIAILDKNPDVAAVTSWHSYFRDGEAWAFRNYPNRSYRPAGQDLGCGLSDNVFGDAFAVYRTKVLREFGGWDAASEAMWEDWEMFVRMTAAGHKIWVIPREMFLYRERPDAMSQIYNRFWGGLRLAAAFPNLPRSEAVSLTRALLSQSKTC